MKKKEINLVLSMVAAISDLFSHPDVDISSSIQQLLIKIHINAPIPKSTNEDKFLVQLFGQGEHFNINSDLQPQPFQSNDQGES